MGVAIGGNLYPTKQSIFYFSNSILMKVNLFSRLLLLMFVVSWVQLVSAQASWRTWDFEEPCAEPSLAFQNGCIPFATAGSGVPSVSSIGGAASGSKYAQMDGCYRSDSSNGNNYAESILLDYDFVSGKSYTISFSYRTFDAAGYFAAPSMPLYLVSNVSGTPVTIGSMDPCGNAGFIPPAIPAANQLVGVLIDYLPSGWQTVTYEVPANANYNQLWFRPQGDDLLMNTSYNFQIDKVSIRESCDPPLFNVSLCQYANSDELTATITSVGELDGQWRMWRAVNCTGGVLTPNFGAQVAIDWTSSNTFSLPDNSGCYILMFVYQPPGCGTKLVRVMINTNANVPQCEGVCDDWSIVVEDYRCSSIFFQVVPGPNNATITATLNGEPVGQIHPGIVEYDIFLMGDDTDIRVCFTVEQPNCPAVTQCEFYRIEDCDGQIGLQGGASDAAEAMEDIHVTNPSTDEIRFSKAIEAGTARLLNLQGQVVKTFPLDWTAALPVHELPAGGYVLHIQTARTQAAKLVTLVR